jgi:formate dehydrogenase maturation protein FdhE
MTLLEMVNHLSDQTKHMVDTLSVGALVATFFNILPQATALLTFIWVAIRLYETKTVQRLLGKQSDQRAED